MSALSEVKKSGDPILPPPIPIYLIMCPLVAAHQFSPPKHVLQHVFVNSLMLADRQLGCRSDGGLTTDGSLCSPWCSLTLAGVQCYSLWS